MVAVRGAPRVRRVYSVDRSVNPRTAATHMFDSRGVGATDRGLHHANDDPRSTPQFPFLEDTLIQATDYACAQTVVHQAILLQPKSPTSILIMATMHELEALRILLETALIQVQMPAEPRTLH